MEKLRIIVKSGRKENWERKNTSSIIMMKVLGEGKQARVDFSLEKKSSL